MKNQSTDIDAMIASHTQTVVADFIVPHAFACRRSWLRPLGRGEVDAACWDVSWKPNLPIIAWRSSSSASADRFSRISVRPRRDVNSRRVVMPR
jgi:hypothetical protein